MAIELHHLHPGHDDEMTRLKARIAELERMDIEHTVQIAKMNGYIHHLEEELEASKRKEKESRELADPYTLYCEASAESLRVAPAADAAGGGIMNNVVFDNTKCCVCGELVTHNDGKILQPQIYVCQFCRENARQMLQIKKFATETNLKVEIKGLNND